MHWSPRDIVFAIGILLPRKEYEPLLLLILIAEGNLNVELLLVEHFDLHVQERLQKVQLCAPVVFWQLQLGAQVGYVHVALNCSIVCLFDAATYEPWFDGLLI